METHEGMAPPEQEPEQQNAGQQPPQAQEAAQQQPGAQRKPQLPGTLSLIGETFKQFGRNWKTFVALSLLPVLVGALLFIPMALFAPSGTLFGSVTAFVVYTVTAIVVGVIFWLICYTGLFAAAALEDRATLKSSLRAGKRLVGSYLLVVLLVGLAIMGGYTLFFIPGIILAVFTILAPFMLVKEKKHGLSALVGSTSLIKGYWWPVFGRMILTTILAVAVLFLPVMIGSIILAALLPETMATQIGANGVQFLVNIVLTPLWTILLYRFYKHLRSFKPQDPPENVQKKRKMYLRIFAILGIIGLFFMVALPFYFFSQQNAEIMNSIEDQQMTTDPEYRLGPDSPSLPPLDQ